MLLIPPSLHPTLLMFSKSFISFKFVLPGYNVRPLNMSGAIGLEQLKKLSKIIAVRRENAKSFQNLFEDHPYIQIQRELGTSSWYGFAIIIKEHADGDRQDIVNKLSKNGEIIAFDREMIDRDGRAIGVYKFSAVGAKHFFNDIDYFE